MGYDIERFSRLVGRFHEAPLDPGVLPAALADLASLAGVEKSSIITASPDGTRSFVAASGFGGNTIQAYDAHFHSLDILCPAFGAPPIAFTCTNSNTYWPDFARSEFFNDWALPNGNNQIAFVSVDLEGGVRSSLILAAPSGDHGFGSSGQIMLLELLAPHFRRMMAMTSRFADLERQRDGLLSAFGQAPHGLILLDRRARVILTTPPADAVLRAGDGLRRTTTGLRARAIDADQRLAALIDRALACHEASHACTLAPVAIPRAAQAHPLLVQAFPLAGASRRPTDPWASARLEDGAVLLMLSDLGRAAGPPAELVRGAFGLTRAEAAVALLLLDGQSTRAAATELGVSISTVRTHLMNIFAKTGTNRQADLVGLLAKLARFPEPGS